MPPDGAEAEPDEQVADGDDEAELSPGALRDVACAVEDWRGAAAVMRQGGEGR